MFAKKWSLTFWLFTDLYKYVYTYENVQGFPYRFGWWVRPVVREILIN